MKKKFLFVITALIVVILYFTIVEVIEHSNKKDKSSKSITTSKSPDEEKPWYSATYSGIKISTPERLEIVPYTISESQKPYISKIDLYQVAYNNITVGVLYMKFLKSDEGHYDFEVGFKSAIGNIVNSLNGTNLMFNLIDSQDTYNKESFGTFNIGDKIFQFCQIGHRNDLGEVATVTIYAPQNDQSKQVISKIKSSIDYLF